MKSIRLRLIALFIVVTTTTLAAFGMYGQQQLSHSLELRFSQIMHATMMRVETSTSEPVWNLDSTGLFRTLEVEMQQEEVNAIQVFGLQDKLLATAMRDPQGQVLTGEIVDDFTGVRVEASLYRSKYVGDTLKDKQADRDYMGIVVVYFTRDYIAKALQVNQMRWLTEILVVDLLLVLALTLSLRMVFAPLQRLRDALMELANSDGEVAKELPLTDATEFGQVIQGFNLTQRKFRQVLERQTLAVEEAHASARKTEQAYAQLQSTQQSLVQAEKLASLGGLVAGVAHEINTPVGVTLTSASVLLDATDRLKTQLAQGTIRKSDINAYVEMAVESARLIMTNADRAAHLIQSFKQVAADQTSEQRRSYELRQYLEEIISSLRPKLKQRQTVVSVLCPEPITLDGYPGTLAQIITNLTMNALIHAFANREQGRIEIAAEQVGDQVTLRFSDDGRGIAPEHIERVFDPFFTTQRGSGGTGLGLNIVFNIIVKQLGGTISVQSELGKGTSFLLTFPLVSPATVQKA